MFCLFKRIKNFIISWFQNKIRSREIQKVLDICDIILEEKGYHDHNKTYWYDHNILYFDISNAHNITQKLPYYITIKDNTIMIKFSNVKMLLETSLEMYCWCCLLKPLPYSRYQQYERAVHDYACNEQNSNIA